MSQCKWTEKKGLSCWSPEEEKVLNIPDFNSSRWIDCNYIHLTFSFLFFTFSLSLYIYLYLSFSVYNLSLSFYLYLSLSLAPWNSLALPFPQLLLHLSVSFCLSFFLTSLPLSTYSFRLFSFPLLSLALFPFALFLPLPPLSISLLLFVP